MIMRNRLLQPWAVTGAAALILAAAGTATAQSDYPDRPVTFVVHTSAGGPLDTMARKMAALLDAELGWSTAVENRQGSSGAVAMSHVMSQPADGYTILGVTKSLPNNMALGRLPAEVEDIGFLQVVQGEPSSLAVTADSDFESLDQFVEYMRENPDGLSIGGSGRGGNDFVHFLLKREAGFESTWIPFDSAPEVVAALLGGHIDAAFMTPSSALAQVQSGDVRLLGLSSEERLEEYPEVPTFAEAGYDVVELLWRGFVVKAGTPPEIVTAINDAIDEVEATAEWQEMMADQNQITFDIKGDAFRQMVEREVRNLSEYYKETGLIE